MNTESGTEKQFYCTERSQENLTPDDGDPTGSIIETVFLDNNLVILQKELFQWNILTRIDKIEYSSKDLFSYEKSDVNKFYSNYFGVINLSDYSIHFKEYRILGRGLEFCPTPPLYDHGMVKESIDIIQKCKYIFVFL